MPTYPISECLRAMRECNAAIEAATSFSEQQRLSRQFAARRTQLNEEFGKLNGWTLTTKSFLPRDIGRRGRTFHSYRQGRWLDHPIFYRDRERRNVAIVGQPYGNVKDYRAELDTCAEEFGLCWHVPAVPRASFWYPGSTLFIVLTLPELEVKWLPEQQFSKFDLKN